MNFIRKLVIAVFSTALLLSGSVMAVAPAQAAACYGAGCNNLDPMGRCNHDAKTVGAMDVGDGMLELRWSPSCVANWGRFTAYPRTEWGYRAANIVIHARVTVWNPGAPSYGVAYHGRAVGESTWSNMTDGRPTACTGVEISHIHQSSSGSGAIDETEVIGWTWGPCR